MGDLIVRPDPTKLYGITHTANGAPVVRVPRTVKIGIGVPAGKDVEVYIDHDAKWVIRAFVAKEVKANKFDTKAEAQKAWPSALKVADTRNYPKKLPYFTFAHVSPEGFEPDWDAIEQHGPKPTEIDIIFTDDQPFEAAYQMWSGSGLKCHGDGRNALRVVEMAQGADEKLRAQEAITRGEKYFPIFEGCFIHNCPYSKETKGQNGKTMAPMCKPHGKLQFQLLSSPRLGGTAYFMTTSFRSVSQIFSCLEVFRTMTGQGDSSRGFLAGIPLKLVLRPFKVIVDQRPSTAYGVSLEFRAETAIALKQKLVEEGLKFRQATAQIAAPLRELPAGSEDVAEQGDDPEIQAGAIMAEFHPAEEPILEEDGEEPAAEEVTGSREAQEQLIEDKVARLERELEEFRAAKGEIVPSPEDLQRAAELEREAREFNQSNSAQGDSQEITDEDLPPILRGTGAVPEPAKRGRMAFKGSK